MGSAHKYEKINDESKIFFHSVYLQFTKEFYRTCYNLHINDKEWVDALTKLEQLSEKIRNTKYSNTSDVVQQMVDAHEQQVEHAFHL